MNTIEKEIKIHYSLLPAFTSDDPVRDAILSGVKVTGITFYYEAPMQILAQYPVFVPLDAHYDTLKLYLEQLGQHLLPKIKEKVINNEQFDIQELISNNKQNSSCSNCSSCNCNSNYGSV